MNTIIVPEDNRKDVDDLPAEVKDNMSIVYASTIDEVLDVALV